MSLHYLTHLTNYPRVSTVAATDTNASYPIANIYHPRLSKVWRSNGDLTDVDITIDLGVARNVNLVGLANHNFSSGVSLAIAAGTTSGVSDFSDTITYREGSAYKILSSTQNYRYWRIRINDSANADGFLEAGYLLLGLTVTPNKGLSFDPGIGLGHRARVNSVQSEFGSYYVDFLNEIKTVSLRFASLNASDRLGILDFLLPLREETNTLFLIPDSTLYDGWYVRQTGTPQEQRNSIVADFSMLTFQEEGSGKRMVA